MNKLLLLTLIFSSFIVTAQKFYIPDPDFRAVIKYDHPSLMDGDSLLIGSAATYTGTLDCRDESIHNLIGIEYFTQLSILDCSHNQINQLDLSNNTELTLLSCSYNQIYQLDLSNNTELTLLGCAGNNLTSINITNSPNLDRLNSWDNNLTSLNLSNNTELTSLICSANNLTSLVLSNNTALTELNCAGNNIISLDLSNNIELAELDCSNNQLSHLDLSNNVNLDQLKCNNNLLLSLNIRNANNINISNSFFRAYNNPYLSCIQVDDVNYSINNWIQIDEQSSFGENCLYDIVDPNIISGNILADINCNIDANEQAIENIIVRTVPFNFYGITDSLGTYIIYTDTGTYQVEQFLTHPLISPLCPLPNYHTVHFDSLAQDTTELNFHNEVSECPLLKVDIASDRRRRCFTSNTILEYCNNGFADASSVEVSIQLPEYVVFVSADYSNTIDTEGNYVFNIGNLAQGDCGSIHIIDSVACIEDITGLTQCTRAWITPSNDCTDPLDPNLDAWDKSSIMVEGECLNDTMIHFTINNTGEYGEGDMQNPHNYRIYVDNALVETLTFQLIGGESINIDYAANGQTIRLEADQHPMHPGNSHPQETIEGCGEYYGAISTGFVNTMPMNDAGYDKEIDCIEIIDSYDPNDKTVSPSGISNNHYLEAGTLLDYQIRFQNTGSDTAYTVVIVDTLSAHLNPSTIQWGLSSHPCTIDVTGMGVPTLSFTFNDIALPDSTTNELASHGFIKFKVAPYDTLANGTEINNIAHIYFDYNMPIITNTAQIIISDTILNLDLTFYNNTGTDIQTACNTFDWIDGNTYTTDNTTATHTILNAAGCDSIITLDLTINYSNTGTDIQTACNTFDWIDGNTYTTDNTTATHTILNATGCDSIITLDLTINTVNAAVTVNDSNISSDAISAAYQWMDCNDDFSILLGEVNQTFTTPYNGDFAVEVEENGCIDTSACVSITSVGIEYHANHEALKIYPNPTTGQLTIEVEHLEQVEIYNISGILIKVTNQKKIDLSQHTKGVYFMKIVTTNNTFTKKIILDNP